MYEALEREYKGVPMLALGAGGPEEGAEADGDFAGPRGGDIFLTRGARLNKVVRQAS